MRTGTVSSQNSTSSGSALKNRNQIVFGTMRSGNLTYAENVDLYTCILANGGRRFHSSHEYESFDLFCRSITAACEATGVQQSKLKHIVKIATPHFGEDCFENEKLCKQIDQYCDALQCNQIETVQWMVRGDLNQEASRLQCLAGQNQEINDSVTKLKASAKIQQFGVFPYTAAFRSAALKAPWCDVILDYYNPSENNNLNFTEFGEQQHFIAIRPFYPILNAEIQSNWTIPELLEFALKPIPSNAVIVSTGNLTHVKDLLALK